MTGHKPDYIAYSVVDQDGGKARWREVGAAFRNSNETESITVLFDAAPLSGKLVLLPPKHPEQGTDSTSGGTVIL